MSRRKTTFVDVRVGIKIGYPKMQLELETGKYFDRETDRSETLTFEADELKYMKSSYRTRRHFLAIIT